MNPAPAVSAPNVRISPAKNMIGFAVFRVLLTVPFTDIVASVLYCSTLIKFQAFRLSCVVFSIDPEPEAKIILPVSL